MKLKEKIQWVLTIGGFVFGLAGTLTWKGGDGIDGVNGINGINGINGTNGVDGVDGQNGKDGRDGLTPYIGANKNWWIGDTDTGVRAEGLVGRDGKDGVDGLDGRDGRDGQTGEIILKYDWVRLQELAKVSSSGTAWVYAIRVNIETGMPEALMYDYLSYYYSGSGSIKKIPICSVAKMVKNTFGYYSWEGNFWSSNSGSRPQYSTASSYFFNELTISQMLATTGLQTTPSSLVGGYWFDYDEMASNPYYNAKDWK